MANNVKKEFELYEPMRKWLQTYLEGRYRGAKVQTLDTHARTLDLYLEELGIIEQYPQVVGLDIQIDVLGVVTKGSKSNIVFIEAKKTQLNLHDLGQLWAYCKLCNPVEAMLLSSNGVGSLNKILNNLGRTDMLNFGEGKVVRQMQVAKWDTSSNAVDFMTVIPKL